MNVPGIPPLVNWVIAIGLLCTALGVIWRFAVRPLVHFLNDADELGPVVREMAKQFKSDSGSTLRDVINALTAQVGVLTAQVVVLTALTTDLKAAAELARHAALTAVSMADRDRADIKALRRDTPGQVSPPDVPEPML